MRCRFDRLLSAKPVASSFDDSHDRFVWFQPFIYSLPIWACVLLAFVPAALVAAVFRPLSVELERDTATTTLRSALIALVSTAFAFLASLSTNTLWGNVSDVSTSVRDMAVQEREMVRLVENYESTNADQMAQLVEKYNQNVIDSELYAGSLIGNSQINDVVEEIRDFVDSIAVESEVSTRLTERMKDFVESRDTYLQALNDPGVPDILWLAVLLLGALLIAVLSLLPIGKSRRFSSLVMVGLVFAVGLIQLPMWVLSSFSTVAMVAVPPLENSGTDAVSDPSFLGQSITVIGALVVLAILVVLTQVWNRRRIKREAAEDDTQMDASSSGGE